MFLKKIEFLLIFFIFSKKLNFFLIFFILAPALMKIGFSAEKFVYSPAKSGVRGSRKIMKT